MSWPDTYKDRYQAAQRALCILKEHHSNTESLAQALAKDPEAAIEFAHAVGELDSFADALEVAAAKHGAEA